MFLVLIFTIPFNMLLIDIAGPLPATLTGHRHILTALCPATKFLQAVPLKELSSLKVVDALLSIFAKVELPTEMQRIIVFSRVIRFGRCGTKITIQHITPTPLV